VPLAIDLFCGLGGWTDGLLAEHWDVVGFDIERHEYGDARYPAPLVLQAVMTLDGRQFRNADLIVASPPCQEFSYMAMPWSRAKQIAAALRGQGEFPKPYNGSRTVGQLTALFDACFRLQTEASDAAGRYIPLLVENVRGAQPWVGRAPWNYGSFYLWGDVPALMPFARGPKIGTGTPAEQDGQKIVGYSDPRRNGGKGAHLTCQRENDARRAVAVDGTKAVTSHAWFNDHKLAGVAVTDEQRLSRTGSNSPARKAASAQIAKIPLELSSYIARHYRPRVEATA